MIIEELTEADVSAATALWDEAELTRPWNDAATDFRRALKGPTSAVLGLRDDGEIVGTVMVGFDGHRGWVYYLAVTPQRRGHGLGRVLMNAAEDWLGAKGAVKVQLMIRSENQSALGFYQQLKYQAAPVEVLSRWLDVKR
ncbi:MAG TPA: GNAT family acetyltransferase [Acidimicrobiales bacterium]|nr:GNAT family acetyltransferase [Acidimicrobiales bacterium]